MANKLVFGRVRGLLNKGCLRGIYATNKQPFISKSALDVKVHGSVFAGCNFSLKSRCHQFRKLEDPLIYEKISDGTLDELSEYLENCFEEIDKKDLDVNFSSGVLTVSLCDEIGTYVINKQAPNKQIWLSSPISGPKRFDFFNGQWIYSHDGSNLHDLLEKELSENLNFAFDMTKLEFYNYQAT